MDLLAREAMTSKPASVVLFSTTRTLHYLLMLANKLPRGRQLIYRA
jgi:hypothetical protein